MELADDPIDINIGFSQRDAGYAATRYLLDLGHRRIGHIRARLDPRSRRRIEGYRRRHGGGRHRSGALCRRDSARPRR